MRRDCPTCGAKDSVIPILQGAFAEGGAHDGRCLTCGDVLPGASEATAEAAWVTFSTGAVRGTDTDGVRYDLVPTVGWRRVGEAMAHGEKKYGRGNWTKGIPTSVHLNHALTHLHDYIDGDRSEDHLGHAAADLFMAMHNEERRPDVHDADSLRQRCDPSESRESQLRRAVKTPIAPGGQDPLTVVDPEVQRRVMKKGRVPTLAADQEDGSLWWRAWNGHSSAISERRFPNTKEGIVLAWAWADHEPVPLHTACEKLIP